MTNTLQSAIAAAMPERVDAIEANPAVNTEVEWPKLYPHMISEHTVAHGTVTYLPQIVALMFHMGDPDALCELDSLIDVAEEKCDATEIALYEAEDDLWDAKRELSVVEGRGRGANPNSIHYDEFMSDKHRHTPYGQAESTHVSVDINGDLMFGRTQGWGLAAHYPAYRGYSVEGRRREDVSRCKRAVAAADVPHQRANLVLRRLVEVRAYVMNNLKHSL